MRLETPPTQKQTAAKYNVGEHTLRQVRAIERSGNAKLLAAVESGDVSIKRAVKKLADREARRRRNREAERNRKERANLPASEGMEIHH